MVQIKNDKFSIFGTFIDNPVVGKPACWVRSEILNNFLKKNSHCLSCLLPPSSHLPRHIKITFSTLLVQLLRALHQVLLLCQHVPFKLIALKHNQPPSFTDWTATMIACKYFRQSGFIFAECDFQKFGWTAPFLEIWAPPEKNCFFGG